MTDKAVEHYDREAERYDRRWRFYIRATVDAVVSSLHLPEGGLLLDVACGTGALEERLKCERRSIRVVGVDASSAMLARAEAKNGDAGYEWVRADAHDLPLGDGLFDQVVCANSIHCFRDPAAALAEFRRVLKKDGRLLVLDWCDDFLTCKFCGLWLRWTDPASRRILSSKQCRRVLEGADFAVDRWRRLRVGVLWGLMLFDCSLARSGGWISIANEKTADSALTPYRGTGG